jgi:hypothetical protein
MSGSNGPPTDEESLFDAIAQLLPSEQRERFYQRMAHMRQLSPHDEMLQIAEAMGFLTFITRETPERMREERERLELVLAHVVELFHEAQRSAAAYQQQMDERLLALPAKVAEGVRPQAIAAKLGETLRQHFQQTGIEETAKALTLQCAQMREAQQGFAQTVRHFADPSTGVASRVAQALYVLEYRLTETSKNIDGQMLRFKKESKYSLLLLAGVILLVGLSAGMLFEMWLLRPSTPNSTPPVVEQHVAPVPEQPTPASHVPHARKGTKPNQEQSIPQQ